MLHWLSPAGLAPGQPQDSPGSRNRASVPCLGSLGMLSWNACRNRAGKKSAQAAAAESQPRRSHSGRPGQSAHLRGGVAGLAVRVARGFCGDQAGAQLHGAGGDVHNGHTGVHRDTADGWRSVGGADQLGSWASGLVGGAACPQLPAQGRRHRLGSVCAGNCIEGDGIRRASACRHRMAFPTERSTQLRRAARCAPLAAAQLLRQPN